MSDLKELNKEQSEIVQRHSEYMKSEVGYALALEECTDILIEFHNEMEQANDAEKSTETALNMQSVSVSLLRELAVRGNYVFPTTPEEIEWFEEGTNANKCDLFTRLFEFFNSNER